MTKSFTATLQVIWVTLVCGTESDTYQMFQKMTAV